MKANLLILPLALLSISCKNNPKQKPEFEESFVTHIESDGTKKFNYSLVNLKPIGNQKHDSGMGGRNARGGGRGGKGNKNGNGGRRGVSKDSNGKVDLQQKMKEKFIRKLEKTLFENAYCSDSYVELDSFYERGSSQFKGQCEEKATSEDRKRFPNQ